MVQLPTLLSSTRLWGIRTRLLRGYIKRWQGASWSLSCLPNQNSILFTLTRAGKISCAASTILAKCLGKTGKFPKLGTITKLALIPCFRVFCFGCQSFTRVARATRKVSIYFLGFTLYCALNRKGNSRVEMRTEKSRLRRALTRLQDQMRRMRHEPIRE